MLFTIWLPETVTAYSLKKPSAGFQRKKNDCAFFRRPNQFQLTQGTSSMLIPLGRAIWLVNSIRFLN